MKKYKLIWMGVGLSCFLLLVNLFLTNHRAFALTTADLKSPPSSYKFLALNTVQATINGKKYNFVDGKTSDSHYSYSSSSTDFCQPGSVSDDDYGIKFDSDPANANNTINGTITLGSPSGPNCIEIGPITVRVTTAGVSGAQFQYSGKNIISLDGKNTYEPFTSGLPANYQGRVYGLGTTPGSCGGADQNDGEGEIIITDSAGGSTGKMYILTNQNNGFSQGDDAVKEFPALAGIITPGTCWDYQSLDPNKGGPQPAISITVTGALGQGPVVTPPPGGTSGGGNAATPGDTCELSSNGFSLAWLMCPLLLAGEEISNNLINAFENELSFNVSQGLGNKDSQASVEKTWSLFKNIATAILVILMLLMVFSQAISAGPFDAYTVRKMLPRMVIVAIAIQLSWPLVSFVIDTFDDIGRGIANIMYFSFGGADGLSLGHILYNGGFGTATAATISWVGLVGGIGLGIAALPALLLLLLATGAAILTAWITLVLRKIIIIMLLMLAPIALLAYVLPGTQRYWKLWIDNLIKILAMFPLVVALVAAGRIFAFIVGTQNNTKFLSFIFICIGFFGPLFFLPKTFKWGGQLMSATANGVASATNRFVGKESALGKGVQGYGERKQGEWAKAYNPNEKSRFKRGFQRVQSGHAIPFSKRSQRLAIASGDKWSQERDEEALALIKRKGEKVMREGYEAAVLTDDKTGFARYKTDAQGNRLGKDGKVAYDYAGKDAKGGDVYKVAGTDEIATNFDDADKERVDSYDQASKRTMTGVAAMKQMWVDLSDEGRDKHERKMAIRQLTATSSWPELQGNLSRRGNKAIDVEDWSDSITTSPEDYPRVLRSRVDATPHIDRGARDKLAAAKVSGRTFDTPQQEKDFISANRVSYGIADQMSNEDFQTQSEGFWQETSRVANLKEAKFVTTANPEGYTPEAIEVRNNLKSRFQSIKEIGGTAPQQLLGHLMGGSIEKRVNEALGPDDSVRNYVVRGAGGQQSPPAGGNPTNPSGGNPPTNPPGGGETMSDDGTIDLHPDE